MKCTLYEKRIQDLEEERASLLTAIRLLREDDRKDPQRTHMIDRSGEEHRPAQDSWQTIERKKKDDRNKKGKGPTNRNTKTNTRSSNAVNDANLQQGPVSHNNSRTPKKSVIILGDSMTSHIQGKKLSREAHVVSKSFSGSTVEDMCDFVKPFVRRQPNQIILHVGTNNLREDKPQEISEKIVNLMSNIEQELTLESLA